jgi:hypothetical protein
MNLYRAAQNPDSRFRSLPNVDPQTREIASYNAYPPLFGHSTEGFHQTEQWGAQFRNAWAVEPVFGSLPASGTAAVPVIWNYANNVLPASGYVIAWNGSDVSVTWTPSWSVTLDGTTYTIPLTDFGYMTTAVNAGSRALLQAPIGGDGNTVGNCTWTATPASAPSTTASIWIGLLYW